MSLYKSFFRGISYNFLAILTSRMLTVLVVVLLARTLGKQGFGLYSFVLAIVTMLIQVADFGMSGALQKYVHHFDEDKINVVISSSFVCKLCCSSLVALIVLVLDYFWLWFRGYGWYLALILFLSSFNLVVMSLNAELKFKQSAVVQILTEAVFAVLVIVVLLRGWGATGALVARGLSYLIIGMTFLVFVVKPKWVPIRQGFEVLYKIMRFGFWATALAFFSVILAQSGIVIVTVLQGDEAAGLLKAAITISTVVLLIPEVIRKPLYPIISSRGNAPDDVQNDQVLAMHRAITSFLLVLLLPVLVLGIFFARHIIVLIFGHEYLGSVYPFCVLLLVNVLSMITVSYFSIFYMKDRIKTLVRIGAVCAIVNITGNFLLVPRFGPTGSAVAVLIAQIVGTIWIIAAFARQHGHKRWRTVIGASKVTAD